MLESSTKQLLQRERIVETVVHSCLCFGRKIYNSDLMVPYEMLAVMCNIEVLEENLTQYD